MPKTLSTDDRSEANAPKKSSAGVWIALGGGCAVLLLCVVCSGGGVGIWYWQKSPANKDLAKGPDAGKIKDGKFKAPVDKIIDDVKEKNALLGTAAIGKAPLSELDGETQVWDFTMRPPKGFKMTGKELNVGGPEEASNCQWMIENPAKGMVAINISKRKRLDTVEPIKLYANVAKRLKSDDTDKHPFEVLHVPQAVEINGLKGARFWMLYPWGPDRFEIRVNYHYQVDGWAYIFDCQCFGLTAEDARRHADLVDVSICTFRKKDK